MAGPVLYPRLGLAVGERDGDERGACIVCTNLLARIGALEENAARDAGGLEVLAVPLGRAALVEGFTAQVDEDEVVVVGGDAVISEKDAPGAESTSDAG